MNSTLNLSGFSKYKSKYKSSIYTKKPLEYKVVERLFNIFTSDIGCQQTVENAIPAVAKIEHLQWDRISTPGDSTRDCGPFAMLRQKEIEQSHLICMHGQHRIAAAKQYFGLFPQRSREWWLVKLYDESIGPETRECLVNSFKIYMSGV